MERIRQRWVSPAVQLLDHVVAIGVAAARLAGLDSPALTAPRLVHQSRSPYGRDHRKDPSAEMLTSLRIKLIGG